MNRRIRQAGCVVLLCAGWAAASARGAEHTAPYTIDWGPLFSRFVNIEAETEHNFLGPVYQHIDGPGESRFIALRPLYSRITDAAGERTRSEYLWPLASSKTFKNMRDTRFLVWYAQDDDRMDADSRYRVWLLPIYFQGRSRDGQAYAALFPLGGAIREFLWQDEIYFALFPLWSYSRVNDAETTCLLWPIVSWTHGGSEDKFRVFPLYGYASKEDAYDKHFVLWPIWTYARYHYPESSGASYILFPLYGRTDLTDQQTWMFLPPLFRFTRGDRRNVVYAPWPFYQRVMGDMDKLYLWPFWGRKSADNTDSSFFLWPLFHAWTTERPDRTIRQFRFIPFYHHAVTTADANPGGAPVESYHQIWPLFSREQRGDDHRLRLLSLWPARNHGPIERNWAPLWRLFEYRTHDEGAYSELLWGLYRYQREREDEYRVQLYPLYNWRKKGENDVYAWSLLKGLFGYEKKGAQKQYRLLWLLKWKTGDEQ